MAYPASPCPTAGDPPACATAESALTQVRALYTELALHPDRDFGWGKGRENARRLGYDPAWLARLPDAVWASAAAVGNPFALAPIRAGDTVVDLGCGTGADLCVAALLAGADGRAIGVDVTPAMVEKARAGARLAGLANVTVHEGDLADLPLPAGFADVALSNGALNLVADKAAAFREIHRVLRPGGRLQFADMVRVPSAGPGEAACDAGSWADCVSGTLPAGQVVDLLREAGFADAAFMGHTDYRTSDRTRGALFLASKR